MTVGEAMSAAPGDTDFPVLATGREIGSGVRWWGADTGACTACTEEDGMSPNKIRSGGMFVARRRAVGGVAVVVAARGRTGDEVIVLVAAEEPPMMSA